MNQVKPTDAFFTKQIQDGNFVTIVQRHSGSDDQGLELLPTAHARQLRESEDLHLASARQDGYTKVLINCAERTISLALFPAVQPSLDFEPQTEQQLVPADVLETRAEQLVDKIHLLAKTVDALAQKLISEEIKSVEDAEEFVGDKELMPIVWSRISRAFRPEMQLQTTLDSIVMGGSGRDLPAVLRSSKSGKIHGRFCGIKVTAQRDTIVRLQNEGGSNDSNVLNAHFDQKSGVELILRTSNLGNTLNALQCSMVGSIPVDAIVCEELDLRSQKWRTTLMQLEDESRLVKIWHALEETFILHNTLQPDAPLRPPSG